MSKGACIKLGLLPKGFPEVSIVAGDSLADEEDRHWKQHGSKRKVTVLGRLH